MRLPTKLFGIIGHPLGQTMSPAIHNWAMEQAGLDGVYMAWPMAPENLAGFMAAVRLLPISGLSVTIPHKENVIPLLDGVSERASAIGAVNTVYWEDGKLLGENTDILGFLAPLKNLKKSMKSALVMGAGGAARAVLAGLKELGVASIGLCNRSPARANALAAEFDVFVVDWEERVSADLRPDLLVNTTPLGMAGKFEDATPWPGDAFAKSMVVYDLVYNPLRTRFIQEAEKQGCTVVAGLEMFVGQAVEQFRLWTGQMMDAQGCFELLRNLLEPA